MGLSVLAALLFSAALLLAGPARADLLAYTCGYDICTINPDEPAERTNLTQTPDDAGVEESPAWSPDGKWIAYSGEYVGVKGSLYQLWVLDPSVPAADVEPVDLSDNAEAQPEPNDPPVWSPDSSLVAYEEIYLSGRAHSNEHHVFVSPFDGTSDAVPIGSLDPAGQSTHPSWTPDGKVVFGRNSLFIANPDGTGISPFASPVTGVTPTVSPDGQYVAIETPTNPSSVVVYKSDGTYVATMPKPGSDTTTDIAWSPDSTRIVYSYHETSDAGLWVGPVANPSAGHVQKAPTGWVDEFDGTFSPDATRIAFDALPADNSKGSFQLFLAPVGGGEATQITFSGGENMHPSWKPCEGCTPVPPNEGGGSGTGGVPSGSGGGGGGGTTKPGGATKVPVKLKLSALGATGGPHFMTISGINCKAEGGHPELLPPELRKACNIEAVAEYTVDNHTLPRVQLKASAIVYAKGSVKVPEGESKPLKLKVTGVGKKYAKPGKKLKLSLTIKMTAPDQKPQKLKKTIKIKIAKG